MKYQEVKGLSLCRVNVHTTVDTRLSTVARMGRCRIAFRQKGSVSIESAIIMPVLSFLFLALTDIGMALNDYLVMTEIIQEGVRKAAQTPELEPGEFDSTETAQTSQPMSVSQEGVHQRVYFLLGLQPKTNLTNIKLKSKYIKVTLPSGMTEDTVTVNVQADYKSMLLSGLKLNITATSPYLF